ncbi:nitrate reductase [Zhengella mangrovi]|uniref:Nitrate reductase n=1 Tax=Zhengella mangrovi TaxID=1982044 RepID=A0A2G1QMY0_9HYPH|nr:nitrate reductase [Zhengella mangrovi]PHP66821.1 nitrate reductase [Zhengella mangrovi]
MQGSVRTACPYCGVGCGILTTTEADGSVTVKGDPDHPANFGRLCSKGSALGETLGLGGRLLHPEIGGARASWDEGLDHVAARFSQTVARHGPDSVAFYVSGQILTEDYYVANKLMKGFIGSANIDTNSRLCMASSVAGHRRAFGSDTVPGTYEDLEEADVVVLAGSNLLWCHPVLYQRIAAARQRRPEMRVVLVDPRRTRTADLADSHLAIEPDSDVALFNGLLNWIVANGHVARDWVEAHTAGLGEAQVEAARWTTEAVARTTGLSGREVQEFYRLWCGSEKVVTCYSQGVNQSVAGTDKVNAIINCHLATARIGRRGMGPFSLTGQPNAMGGREVGGLANMLAAHLDIENADHRTLVQDFWQAPRMAVRPGLKAVEMFQAVADGRIRAIWIMGTNPVVSMPQADRVAEALAACPFVVVSDVVAQTDTTRLAHVKLPSLAWGEKDGTVTNSERRISRQRAFLPAPGEARADWWQMAQVGQRMGWGRAFDWPDAASIFGEHAALTGRGNAGRRDLDIGALAGLPGADYDALPPFQWPQAKAFDPARTTRFFADGGFFTPDRKARFIPVSQPAGTIAGPGVMRLNTGRIRDQWHTMTRTGRSPRLSAHIAEPYCEIHPADAARLGIGPADLVRLSAGDAAIVVRAMVSTGQKPGNVFVPMHWNGTTASAARVDALVAANTDPVSGQPASKGSMVTVRKAAFSWHGFLVSRERPRVDRLDYWAMAPADAGWRLEFAVNEDPGNLVRFLHGHLALPAGDDTLTALDQSQGILRAATFSGSRMSAAMYMARTPAALSRSFAVQQLLAEFGTPQERWRVLAGRPPADMPDKGAIVCSCMGIGANQIADAVRAGCRDAEDVGKRTAAGTSCGSCRAEIMEIIHAHTIAAAE